MSLRLSVLFNKSTTEEESVRGLSSMFCICTWLWGACFHVQTNLPAAGWDESDFTMSRQTSNSLHITDEIIYKCLLLMFDFDETLMILQMLGKMTFKVYYNPVC